MRRIVLIIGTLVWLGLIGGGLMACTTPRPTGVIPPPSPPRVDIPEKSQWPEEKAVPAQPDRARDGQETIERFRQAYIKAGRPRIAVYLNRQLSDEVEEWITDSREVTTKTTTSNHQPADKSAQGTSPSVSTSETASYSQKHAGLGGRRSGPDEAWIWGFEDGFLEPFLAAGAQVLDRAVLLRQAAAQPGTAGGATPLAVKTLEMEALGRQADLFMELLVTRSPDSVYGYEFKASAKDIKTGMLRANVSSLRWPAQAATKQVAVPTAKGYEYVEKKADIPPAPQVAGWLAVDLMKSLMRSWDQEPKTSAPQTPSPAAATSVKP